MSDRDFLIECPGCHARLADRHLDLLKRTNVSGECYKAFSDLQCYSVAKQDTGFIHQHVVDAYAAQHAGGPTRPITVAFGLIRVVSPPWKRDTPGNRSSRHI